MKDTGTLGTSYDYYLQNAQQLSSYGFTQAGDAGVARSVGGEMYGFRGGNASLSFQDPVTLTDPGFRSLGPQDTVANGRLSMGFRSQVPFDPLVRPMLPEKEISLPHDASNTLFVEGLPRDATEREIARIRYKMDLHDPDSWALRLQFAKFPARRPGHGYHGRR